MHASTPRARARCSPAPRVHIALRPASAASQVAKEASDIVIMDDRFSSIVAAVRWGRSIKENIRKFLTFQLTINAVALTLTFVTACANGGSTDAFPITPVQVSRRAAEPASTAGARDARPPPRSPPRSCCG